MKIKGLAKLRERSATVPIGHDDEGNVVSLRLVAPDMTAFDSLVESMPEPVAPMSGGVLRNPDGSKRLGGNGQPLVKRNLEDPGYLQAVEDRTFCIVMAGLSLCIGDQIDTELSRDDFDTDAAYYLGVARAMEACGVGRGTFRKLTEAATQLVAGGPVSEEFDEARAALGIDQSNPGN